MPFPNEHASRQTDPKQYDDFRRVRPKGFPFGIDVIFGIKTIQGQRKSEIQSLRFDSSKWTPEKAKMWLKDHGFKTTLEEAIKKDFWHGVV